MIIHKNAQKPFSGQKQISISLLNYEKNILMFCFKDHKSSLAVDLI